MATATETIYTPEDLLTITDRPMPELVDGRLVEREMSQESDGVGATIIGILHVFVKPRKLGRLNGAESGYQIFPDKPRKVRIPDASFTHRDRIKGPRSKGHAKTVPDLLVEVISPNDDSEELMTKIGEYQAAGVRLIWVVSPAARTVRTYLLTGEAPLLREGDILTGGDVLPGFECPVADLFEEP